MTGIVRIGLLGAGLIGKEHANYCMSAEGVELTAIADPSPAGQEVARELDVPHFVSYIDLMDEAPVDAVIVALPNIMHADAAVAALERGLTPLVEKPIADSLEAAERIIAASDKHNVPVLVGHQRRYAPDIVAAKRFIEDGGLGHVVSVGLLSTWRKDEKYFDVTWRSRKGGGPVLINLIHDLDVIRYLAGDIDSVMALGSSKVRGFPVPDTAGAVLEFASGAIGTAMATDAAASPWCWDLTSGYGAYFPSPPPGDVYFISGTEASIALPSLTVYRHRGANNWKSPFETSVLKRTETNPYVAQLEHLAAVTRRQAEPLISARDAFNTLAVAMAIDESMASRKYLQVPQLHDKGEYTDDC
ncbi:Gfo/Idh/MocA family protein [Arthrobacter sulfonylureivorans]|uniref:Gfo/Idh/MocA family protein n=1 Tax=Arthrobacter sulfonylureivorans TaxID=2486855 RepID=UPI0039E69FAD